MLQQVKFFALLWGIVALTAQLAFATTDDF